MPNEIVHGGLSYEHTTDVETRMPLSNEKETRRMNTRSQIAGQGAPCAIKYSGDDGKTNPTPTQLPVSLPRLMWNGQPAITTSQRLKMKYMALIYSTIRQKAPIKRGRH